MSRHFVTILILALLASNAATYYFAHRAGYNSGKTVGKILGQAEGALQQQQKDDVHNAGKLPDINSHIANAYNKGCEDAWNTALTAEGYNTASYSTLVKAKCDTGSSALPYYNW